MKPTFEKNDETKKGKFRQFQFLQLVHTVHYNLQQLISESIKTN